MRFTAVVVAASLACASSVSAFLSPLSFLGGPFGMSPYGGGAMMSGCGNQAGVLNVGVLNYNNCGSVGAGGPGFSGMSCGNQFGAVNIAALTSNSCAGLGAGAGFGSFLKNDVSSSTEQR